MVLNIIRAGIVAGGTLFAVSAATAQGLSFSDFYAGAALTTGELGVNSGGFNTAGSFTNADCFPPEGRIARCSNSDTVISGSLMVGLANLATLGSNMTLRAEAEVSAYGDSEFVTGSYPGASPFRFFYDTEITNLRAGFANLYLDHALDDRFTLFAGAGVGAASMTVATKDRVVEALPQSVSGFAWNAGFGVSYRLKPGVSLFTQYRYVDFGKADVDLTGMGGSAPAGNYELDLHSNEVRTGLMVRF